MYLAALLITCTVFGAGYVLGAIMTRAKLSNESERFEDGE